MSEQVFAELRAAIFDPAIDDDAFSRLVEAAALVATDAEWEALLDEIANG